MESKTETKSTLKRCPDFGPARLMTAMQNCVALFEQDYIQTGKLDSLPEVQQDRLVETFAIIGAIVWSPKDDPNLEQWLKTIGHNRSEER